MTQHTITQGISLAAAAVLLLAVAVVPAFADVPGSAIHLAPLTTDGCCTRPFWSLDSQQVLFIDKPDELAPTGIYGVDTTSPLEPELVTPRVALYTPGMSYLIDLQSGSTTIERVADGERWTVPAEGASVTISPEETRIAWSRGNSGSSTGGGTSRIWTADLDGGNETQVATMRGASVSGWISEDALLVSGRDAPNTLERVLYRLSVPDGELTELARADNLRGQILSTDGSWVAYYVAPNPDPEENGLWVARTDGSARFRVSPELFGSYQWRDDHRLLLIPLQFAAENHELWELDANTRETRLIHGPDDPSFKVNDGDWSVSPDGMKLVFVSARDDNLWLLPLPE